VRAYNYSAGPAALPLPVLEQVRDELLNWKGGMSVMEVSHRSRAFVDVAERAEADLRELLAIPPNYRVLFMQGGATAQFSAVPLNLAESGATADYLHTGHWSERTIKEAKRFVTVNVAADEIASNYTTVPAPSSLALTGDAAGSSSRTFRQRPKCRSSPTCRPPSSRARSMWPASA
jgi:phosphoserine aminotransferase